MRMSRHAVVTGATGQLGSALAEQLATRGYSLSLCALEVEELRDIADALRERHAVPVETTTLDIRDHVGVRSWIEDRQAHAAIDVVVLNAGIGGQIGDDDLLEEPERTRDLVDVNLSANLNLLHTFLPGMRERGSGRIIFISSMSAYIGFPKSPVYAATKSAMRNIALSLYPALSRCGIGVTVACPGFLSGAMHGNPGGWRPFAITPEQAARRIVDAAEKNRTEVSFPTSMRLLVGVLARMPLPLRATVYRLIGG